MAAARKRPRPETDESRAECPFAVRLVDPKEKEQKGKKRRKKSEGEEDDGTKKILQQLSPFSPSGKFKTFETMDVHYMVEPAKKWSDMTRYNSFVLNGIKYFSEGFIFVANESTIERQKAIANKDQMQQPRKKSDDDWVARILEIRASDEHHVYARVYWMYWPDELPAGTHDGRKSIQGRQPYHGVNELVASNHMDIINVVSVTSQAQVNQMIEDNDEDIQNAMYWRQAIDVRTFELSTIETVCKCNQPMNPDKVLVGCANEGCGKWLHDECLLHDALLKTYERLGKDKPHKGPESAAKEGEAKRPLSPTETGAAVSAQHSIDVNVDGVGEDQDGIRVNNDNVEVGRADDDDDAPATSEDAAASESLNKDDDASADTPGKSGSKRGPGRPRKHKSDGVSNGSEASKGKPYEGLFEAELITDIVAPPTIEIKDLRQGIEGGEKSWIEPIDCLICGSRIQ